MNGFHTEEAVRELHALLAAQPAGRTAARAHLYLGLIAMNDLKTDLARREFKMALSLDPTIDVVDGSPKARLAFLEERRALEAELSGAGAPLPPAPITAVSRAQTSQPHRRSHALSITLGAVGLAAAGAAIYGGVYLADYDAWVSGASTSSPIRYSAAGQAQAKLWAGAFIPFLVAGVLGLGAGALTW